MKQQRKPRERSHNYHNMNSAVLHDADYLLPFVRIIVRVDSYVMRHKWARHGSIHQYNGQCDLLKIHGVWSNVVNCL